MLLTPIPGLALRPLGEDDAPALHELISGNRDHLTAHGDYGDLVQQSLADLREDLRAAGPLNFGVFADNALVGQMHLVPVDPPRYGLGYWLSAAATGKGYATAALLTLLDHARSAHGATDVLAGVSHGNDRSEALLMRTGFSPAAGFAAYTRFHRHLAASGLTFRIAGEADTASLAAIDSVAMQDRKRVAEIGQWTRASQCFCAMRDGSIVGYGVHHHHFFGRPFLEMVMVAPTERGKGIGRALVAHAVAIAAPDPLWTSTNQSNAAMLALLLGLGFVQSGKIEGLDEGDPELVFRQAPRRTSPPFVA